MPLLIGFFAGGWIWMDTGNVLSGVMGFLILWFIFAALGAILELFTTKEGGAGAIGDLWSRLYAGWR